MNTQEYLKKMEKIQNTILEFLDDEGDLEENFRNVRSLFNDQNISDDQHELKSLLNLLGKIADNHHRSPDFFTKFDKIFDLFSKEIKQYFTNIEIYNIFKKNKRIILMLIEKSIIQVDDSIFYKMKNDKYEGENYVKYFLPEVKNFIEFKEENLPENFYENRKSGENNSIICQFIRNDQIDDFVIYVHQTNISLDSIVKRSIYETNIFLIKNKELSLILYAAFFGSIQIFNYLRYNNAKMSPSLLLYAIHSNNPEFINLIEEINVDKNYLSNGRYLNESIICHHNGLANYLMDNCICSIDRILFVEKLRNYNFAFLQKDEINQSIFNDLCKYDYYQIVDMFLRENDINIDGNNKNKISIDFLINLLFSMLL